MAQNIFPEEAGEILDFFIRHALKGKFGGRQDFGGSRFWFHGKPPVEV